MKGAESSIGETDTIPRAFFGNMEVYAILFNPCLYGGICHSVPSLLNLPEMWSSANRDADPGQKCLLRTI